MSPKWIAALPKAILAIVITVALVLRVYRHPTDIVSWIWLLLVAIISAVFFTNTAKEKDTE